MFGTRACVPLNGELFISLFIMKHEGPGSTIFYSATCTCTMCFFETVLHPSLSSLSSPSLLSSFHQIPSLVLGPFGCGKTRTLSECVKLLALFAPEMHVLICTHSNSAANLYVEGLHMEWNSEWERGGGGGGREREEGRMRKWDSEWDG